MSKKVLECLALNKEVANKRLAIYTWGNVSVRDGSIVNIKPSGIPFNSLKEEDISQVDIETGRLIKGKKPSVDTAIHLEIYKAFPNTGAVIHTHSTYASTFAQAKKDIPILGTTHADYFPTSIPVADQICLQSKEKMETLVGKSLVKKINDLDLGTLRANAILIPSHGPVVWCEKSSDIVEYAVVLEELAKLAYFTLTLNPLVDLGREDLDIFNFHFERKNGKEKYYGQDIR